MFERRITGTDVASSTTRPPRLYGYEQTCHKYGYMDLKSTCYWLSHPEKPLHDQGLSFGGNPFSMRSLLWSAGQRDPVNGVLCPALHPLEAR